MIRSELCAIADMSPSTFNSHRRNGDLPFEMTTREAKDGAGRTWSRFDIYDAMHLIAARNLVATQGVTWSEAARTLRSRDSTFVGSSHYSYEDQTSIFIAKVDFANIKTGEAPFLMSDRSRVFRGPLSKILETAEQVVVGYNERRANRGEVIEIVSIASVNLSHCYRIATRAAEVLKIDLSNDGAPDEGAEA